MVETEELNNDTPDVPVRVVDLQNSECFFEGFVEDCGDVPMLPHVLRQAVAQTTKQLRSTSHAACYREGPNLRNGRWQSDTPKCFFEVVLVVYPSHSTQCTVLYLQFIGSTVNSAKKSTSGRAGRAAPTPPACRRCLRTSRMNV